MCGHLVRRSASWLIAVLCVLLGYQIPALALASSQWTGWTCDELTPSLCELTVETGSVSIRGINVKYWTYQRADKMLGGHLLPIVTLHGGPALPHNYMLPLKQLACRGSQVIFFDQAGCGESALPEGSDVSSEYPWLLDPSYYAEEELPSILSHLGLDSYHLLAHSGGTINAQLFALNAKNTKGLASLTLSGPLSDLKSYIAAQWEETEGNLASLPPFVQARLHQLESEKAYQSAEYRAIDDVLTTYFSIRTAPFPDCFREAADGLNQDIYVHMQGPSEFSISGVLASVNFTARLDEIKVPVLLTSGRYDTVWPSIVDTIHEGIPQSETFLLEHSGHFSMIDDAGTMNDVVSDFLSRAEGSFLDGSGFIPKDWNWNSSASNDNSSVTTSTKPEWTTTAVTAACAFGLGLLVGNWRLLCGNTSNGYEPIQAR